MHYFQQSIRPFKLPIGCPGEPLSALARPLCQRSLAAVVQQILAVVNQVAEELTEADKQRVTQHFVMTSRFEHRFWDMGYRQQPLEV